MNPDLDSEPATMGDLVMVATVLALEVVAACSANSKEANERLEDIAGKLLDSAGAIVPGRARTLMEAFAQGLISTEDTG